MSIWTDPATGRIYCATTLNPITTAGPDLGEKPRDLRQYSNQGPPLTDEAIEAFARRLVGRRHNDERRTDPAH